MHTARSHQPRSYEFKPPDAQWMRLAFPFLFLRGSAILQVGGSAMKARRKISLIAPSERHAAVSQQHPRILRRLSNMTRILDLDKPRDPTFVKDLLL